MSIQRPTVGIFTLGCKVNQYESEAIGEALERVGFTPLVISTASRAVCDCYIINTCTVTAESDRKARQMIRRAHARNKDAYILVCGCLAQWDAASIAAIEGVDFVCGNRDKLSVVTELQRLWQAGRKPTSPTVCVPSLEGAPFEAMSICHFNRTRAYVKIEDGCENRCTYCIIPSVRGSVRSKPLDAVVQEVKALLENRCQEVVLTGIETASWGKDIPGQSLSELLVAVDAIPDMVRVRLGSLDPSLMRPAFVERIAALRTLCPHFHLSLQSGSDRILALMKRKYNRTQALAAIARLREAIPGAQFTTDVIVGFPGESEEDFKATLDFVREARFLTVHVFPYSRRVGTPAAIMPDQVPEECKHERVRILSALAADIRRQLLQDVAMQRPVMQVLFETFHDGVATGHTPEFIEVRVPSEQPLHATLRDVQLTGVTDDGCGCTGHFVSH